MPALVGLEVSAAHELAFEARVVVVAELVGATGGVGNESAEVVPPEPVTVWRTRIAWPRSTVVNL